MAAIELSKKQAKKVRRFLCGELNYQIYESHAAGDYRQEIKAELLLLEKLGKKKRAKRYRKDAKQAEKEERLWF